MSGVSTFQKKHTHIYRAFECYINIFLSQPRITNFSLRALFYFLFPSTVTGNGPDHRESHAGARNPILPEASPEDPRETPFRFKFSKGKASIKKRLINFFPVHAPFRALWPVHAPFRALWEVARPWENREERIDGTVTAQNAPRSPRFYNSSKRALQIVLDKPD